MVNALSEASKEFSKSDEQMLTATGHVPGQLWTNQNERLGARDSRKIDNHTYLQRRGDDIAVKLHDTDVVTFKKDGSVVLDSGGWLTPTTKDRINDNLGDYGYISQKNRQWTVHVAGKEYPYKDGMTIMPGGRVEGAGTMTEKEGAAKKRLAHKRARKLTEDLFEGNLDENDEALVWDAVREYPISNAATWALKELTGKPLTEDESKMAGIMMKIGAGDYSAPDSIERSQIEKSLRRYYNTREGLA
jgi:hypothetical protein